jgi:hypothetical protein
MLPLSSLLGSKDKQGQPSHYKSSALQVDVSEESPASCCMQ